MEAIVLAGGRGTRLGSLTEQLPKPLVEVRGKPFIFWVLDYLGRHGISKVILSVGYRSDQMIQRVGKRYGKMQIDYCIEENPKGTGGGIRAALKQATQENVFVFNGDTLFPVDLGVFLTFHNEHAAHASIALRRLENTGRFGRVTTSGDRVVSFDEKGQDGPGCINGGVYLLNRGQVLSQMTLPDPFSFEVDFLMPKLKTVQVFGLAFDQFFIDIGVPADLARAEQESIFSN